MKYYIGTGIIVVLMVVLAPFTIISAGQRGVVLRMGAVNRVLGEGVHWVTPLIESVQHFDVRTQKEQVESQAASKDLQTVKAVIALNYNLLPEKVGDLWQTIGGDYKTRVIDPAIQESVKAATAKYTAEELVTKRQAVKDDIKNSLIARLQTEFIIVSDVSIVDFDFSDSFNQAIEAKVTAEQNALGAKNKLEQVKFEAEQKIATARADAESIKLQSDAANNEKYVSLKRIEVQEQMAKKWDGKLPVNMYAGAPLPLLDITGNK